jgi:hypothetical protein
LRFSAKARGPSFASSLAKIGQPSSSSFSSATDSGMLSSYMRSDLRIACTESGPFSQIVSAIFRASASADPVGTTRPISPNSFASCALTWRAVSRISAASVYGIWRRKRIVEPPSGKRPRFASVTPKTADSPATRMSVPCRISVPPATA